MDENNNLNSENEQKEQEQKTDRHVCFENHCWKMCLAMVIAAFLGGFFATYFVADQIAERHMRKHSYMPHPFNSERIERKAIQDYDKIYEKNLRDFERVFERDNKFEVPEFNIPSLWQDGVKIETDYDDDEFEVTVSLKQFNNDESKVNYNVSGRKLTVFGNAETKDKNIEQSVSFSQDFILPDNADTANITKKKDGHKLKISVPLK